MTEHLGGNTPPSVAGDGGRFTPLQQRLMAVLADGLAHGREELSACLDDELAGPTALTAAISRLRDKLRPQGQNVRCETVDSRTTYRLVITLSRR